MPRIKLEKRGQQKRKIKPVILIITEGSKTEPMYFDNFRTRQNNIDVRIVGNKSDGAKTDYDHLLAKAVVYKKEEQISIEYGDSTWIVADGDIDFKTQGNDYRSVQAELNKYIPNYEKSKDIYSQISPYTGQATEHAKRIEKSHINNGYILPFGLDVSPYTDVYKLIEKFPSIYPTT